MMEWRPEPLVFSQHYTDEGQRIVTVERWPRQIEVDAAVLAQSDHLDVRGDELTITVSNGRATYVRTGMSLTRPVYHYALESCRLTPSAGGGS